MVIAVDFDGTLFTNNFPNIGEPIWKTIEWVKHRKSIGDKLILWTCRCDEQLQIAVDACEKVGITFDFINSNDTVRMEEFKSDSRKISADIYVDDKAIRPEELSND